MKAKEKADKERKEKEAKWKEDYSFENTELKESISSFKIPPNANMNNDVASDMSPVELFELFFDDGLLNYIVEQTNKYALEKGAQTWDDTDKEEIRCSFWHPAAQWLFSTSRSKNVLGGGT